MRTTRTGGRPRWQQLALPEAVIRQEIRTRARGAWHGASRDRRSLRDWAPTSASADEELSWDLPTLRARARDLHRNDTFAGALIETKVTNVVGAGLTPIPDPDGDVLALDDQQIDQLSDAIEAEWRLFSGVECDWERVSSLGQLIAIAYRGARVAGDSLIVLRHKERAGSPYALKLQLIEAERLSNPDGAADSDRMSGGVERNDDGEVIAYHVSAHHPMSMRVSRDQDWIKIPAFDVDGQPLALHLMDKQRPAQSRGIPDLASIMEPLKVGGRYTEAEMQATLISALFTGFIISEDGNGGIAASDDDDGADRQGLRDTGVTMGNGALLELGPGDDIKFADPTRPNSNFEAFMRWVYTTAAARAHLPIELVLMRFDSSYTAARAAVNEAWRYFHAERAWIVRDLLQPLWLIWWNEAIARRRLRVAGYWRSPAVRSAVTAAKWIGPARGQVDDRAEMQGVIARVDQGITTLEEETAAITGTSWRGKVKRRMREAAAQASIPGASAPGKTKQGPPGQVPKRPDPGQPAGDDNQDSEESN